MPADDRSTPRDTREGSGLPLVAGALLVAGLVGTYVLLGTPGLHTQVAKAPAGQPIDVTLEQPSTPAPASSDTPAPASGR
jgi:hypothetical protein